MFSRERQVSEEFTVVDGFQGPGCQNAEPDGPLPGQNLAEALTSESWNAVSFINTALSIVAGRENLRTYRHLISH